MELCMMDFPQLDGALQSHGDWRYFDTMWYYYNNFIQYCALLRNFSNANLAVLTGSCERLKTRLDFTLLMFHRDF